MFPNVTKNLQIGWGKESVWGVSAQYKERDRYINKGYQNNYRKIFIQLFPIEKSNSKKRQKHSPLRPEYLTHHDTRENYSNTFWSIIKKEFINCINR